MKKKTKRPLTGQESRASQQRIMHSQHANRNQKTAESHTNPAAAQAHKHVAAWHRSAARHLEMQIDRRR